MSEKSNRMTDIDRRQFLQIIGFSAVAVAGTEWQAMAGPFQKSDFAQLIPADKKLRLEWVAALTARGKRTTYTGSDLDKIGMPVGGICTGTVYLSGDGRLWHWDIFNRIYDGGSNGPNYAHPMRAVSPLDQGFALHVTVAGKSTVHSLDRTGFSDVTFCGEYPIGFVEYRDPKLPVEVSLEAFSPFIPLDEENSGLPATILRYTVRNASKETVEAELGGWLENAVCLHSAQTARGARHNNISRTVNALRLECSAVSVKAERDIHPPQVFADFEGANYGDWKAEGEAFGAAPAHGNLADDQHVSGFSGKGFVNSYLGKDGPQGKLISPQFTISRPYLRFLIGGGNHPNETCINLVIDGTTVRTETGQNTDALKWAAWQVEPLIGKSAHLEIVDVHSGGWGHICIDQIEFADEPMLDSGTLEEAFDFGTMTLTLLDAHKDDFGSAALPAGGNLEAVFVHSDPNPAERATENKRASVTAEARFGQKLMGALSRKMTLQPGQEATVTFAITWHFPNLKIDGVVDLGGRHYATRFDNAAAVSDYLAANHTLLTSQTKLWHDTWYDSTLPYWFLDRTFANTSTLATSTCYRLASGRFYAWEGVGCCAGTCTHVWQYAQAVGRIFPALERDTRERVDYELAFDPNTGVIDHRGEFHVGIAIDGQAGTILRAYREHQMSGDSAFLKRTWLKIKRSLECLIERDGNGDGILEGAQHNTLDAEWFGQISWLSSLYLAALRAGEEMAHEVGDTVFAAKARTIFDRGTHKIMELYDGEFFIQKPDRAHLDAVGSWDGCLIDQVFGQSWAFQVGLGRILPAKETRSALNALWKYNFTPDVGPYRKIHTTGRWYAMPGEGGMLMVTHPKGDDKEFKDHPSAWSAMYFNECMSGFEHQVAGHMLWEGMLTEGLAVIRTIHDRYHPSRRNPWNEVECSDHYARAMASYGVFLAAAGYEHHGPKGHLGFAPRLSPEDFKSAFTAAEGWGSYSQQRKNNPQNQQTHQIELKSGRLSLRTLAFTVPADWQPTKADVEYDGAAVASAFTNRAGRIEIKLKNSVTVKPGQQFSIVIA